MSAVGHLHHRVDDFLGAVEVERELAGNGAKGLELGRRVDADGVLEQRQHRRAEQRRVLGGDEEAVAVGAVHAAQELADAGERGRAAVERRVAQNDHAIGGAGEHDGFVAFDEIAAVLLAFDAQRHARILVDDRDALVRGHAAVGAVEVERCIGDEIDEIDGLLFAQIEGAPDGGAP